jgi:hypothetical protein
MCESSGGVAAAGGYLSLERNSMGVTAGRTGTEAGWAELEGHHIPSLLCVRLPYCSAFRYHGADT